MYGLLVGFGLMFDKGQKQSSTLSCDSSYKKFKEASLCQWLSNSPCDPGVTRLIPGFSSLSYETMN